MTDYNERWHRAAERFIISHGLDSAIVGEQDIPDVCECK